MNSRTLIVCLCFGLATTLSCFQPGNTESTYTLPLQEASGISAMGDTLLLVGDDNPGRYFKLFVTDTAANVLAPDPQEMVEVILDGAETVVDLESIDILADGRVVVLSEDLTSLAGPPTSSAASYGLIARYPPTLNEFGNKGLEGLAVVPAANGASRTAILWEGGYPDLYLTPPQLAPLVGRTPLKPIILVHTIPADSSVDWVHDPDTVITLQVPEPEGKPPDAMRYRASDLVWHAWHEADSLIEGFIVLIAPANSPVNSSPTYGPTEALRFTMDGRPFGESINVQQTAVASLQALSDNDLQRCTEAQQDHILSLRKMLEEEPERNINFEGLGWFRQGKRLVTVFDRYPIEPTLVFFVDVPRHWY